MKKLLQKGFTIVELIAFITIIGIVGTTLFVGLNTALISSHEIEDTEQALTLAQQRMEMILGQYQSVGFAGFSDPCSPAIFPDFMCALGGFSYGFTVVSSIAPNWSGDPNYKVITVTVSVTATAAPAATLRAIVGDYDS